MDESQIPRGFAKPKENPWVIPIIVVCLVGVGFAAWLIYNYVLPFLSG